MKLNITLDNCIILMKLLMQSYNVNPCSARTYDGGCRGALLALSPYCIRTYGKYYNCKMLNKIHKFALSLYTARSYRKPSPPPTPPLSPYGVRTYENLHLSNVKYKYFTFVKCNYYTIVNCKM